MSEQKPSENLIKVWADTQQKLLTNWLNTVRSFGGTPNMELWSKTVEAWQASVKETLDTRAQWMHEWTESLANAKGTPEEMRALAKQGREAVQRWTEAERQLWQGWFNIAKDINFRMEPGTGGQAGKDIVQVWQEAAHKMIDAQADWVRRWTDTGTRRHKE